MDYYGIIMTIMIIYVFYYNNTDENKNIFT